MTTRGEINSNFYQLVNVDGNGNVTSIKGEFLANANAAGSNTQVQFNNNGVFGADSNLTYNNGTQTLSSSHFAGEAGNLSNITAGNITGVVANATYAVTSNTSYSVSGSNVSGTVANANYAVTSNTSYNVSGSNVSGTVANATFAISANTVRTNSQPNITSTGTLTGLTSTGIVNFTGASNVSLGNVSNVKITGGTNGYVLSTNGLGGLSWVAQTGGGGNGTPGGSNTQVQFNDSGTFGADANFAFNKSTNTLNVDNIVSNGSQLTNLTGSNVTGTVANATYATSAGSATTAGTVTTNSQPNITSTGTLSNLNVSGDATITGNLSVSGNTEYTNVNNLYVKDPIIELGGGANNTPLTTNDGKDRGTLLHYYTTGVVDAFMGWDNSGQEFIFGSNVTNSNEVITVNNYGNVHANYYLGNGSQLTGVTSVTSNFANYAGTVTNSTQSNITTVGNLTNLTVVGNASANSLQLNTNTGVTTANVGAMFWDATEQTVTLGMNNGVQQQIGLENYILVKANTAITNGQAVMFVGAAGENVLAAPANMSSAGFKPSYIIGIATQDIAHNDKGYITVFGVVHDVNTNAYNVGDILYVDPASTTGGLTSTEPTAPNYHITIGAVTKKSGTGHIQVRVTVHDKGDDLSDANISSPSAGQALIYTSSNTWVNGNPNVANTSGTVTTNSQPNITSTGTLTNLTVTGNVTTSGNLILDSGGRIYANYIDATLGNSNSDFTITVGNAGTNPNIYFNSNVVLIGQGLSGVGTGTLSTQGTTDLRLRTNLGSSTEGLITMADGANGNISLTPHGVGRVLLNKDTDITGNLTISGTYTGTASTVTTNSQPNITSTGTLTGLTMASNANIAMSGALSRISGGNLLSATYLTGTLTTASQPSITSTGTLTSLGVTGNITAANITANTGVFTGNGSGLTGVTATTAGTVTTNSQPNITSTGTLTGLTVSNLTANINFQTIGNVLLPTVTKVVILGGSSGQFLKTNGSGSLSWDNPTALPGGSDTQVQYNSSNTFAGSSALTFNGTTLSANAINLLKFNETVVSNNVVSGNISPDVNTATIFNYRLTGNITLNSLTNAVAGTSVTLILEQNISGSKILTSTMKFAGGVKTLSTTGGAIDILSIFYDGGTYYASLSKAYA